MIYPSAFPEDPFENVKAAEDFMLLILHTHIVAAGRHILSIKPTDSLPALAESVVDTFLTLPQHDCSSIPTYSDGVHVHALEIISLGLIWYGFHDSMKEGDGDRLICY